MADICELCDVPVDWREHETTHRIKLWNRMVWLQAQEKAAKEFQARLQSGQFQQGVEREPVEQPNLFDAPPM